MAAAKLATRRVHGSFSEQQAQVLAQQGAVQTNRHVDVLRVLNNRAYVALATDATLAAVAAYTTLLTANITTILDRGFLVITFTASTVKITNIGNIDFRVVVDGVPVKGAYATAQVVNTAMCLSMVIRVPVRKGAHAVLLQWLTNSNSARINAKTIFEEHAHLLVQEAV